MILSLFYGKKTDSIFLAQILAQKIREKEKLGRACFLFPLPFFFLFGRVAFLGHAHPGHIIISIHSQIFARLPPSLESGLCGFPPPPPPLSSGLTN